MHGYNFDDVVRFTGGSTLLTIVTSSSLSLFTLYEVLVYVVMGRRAQKHVAQ
jgi:hypothetical protein